MGSGRTVILAGRAGAGLTERLLKEQEEVLAERFPNHFLEQARRLARFAVDEDVCRGICEKAGKNVYEPVGPGGIFGALWRLGEKCASGLVTGFDRIDILQEFIEICNALGVNPYTADDPGSVLIAAEEPQQVTEDLRRAGIPADIIGEMTEDAARVIMRGDTRCYINKDE